MALLLRFPAFAMLTLTFALSVTWALPVRAQNVPVLMLSDIHFDPYRDATKFEALRKAPASEWSKILSGPSARPGEAAEPCPSRGPDTDWTLYAASLKAEKARLAKPVFVTVSGDLMAHEFDCRFKALAGKDATPAEYSAFAAKTVAFVALELKRTFPGVPVYFALGNNDSSCGDYREDPSSGFLREDAATFAKALPEGDRAGVLKEFPTTGSDSAKLPAPFVNTRLIVWQDLFESSNYKTCSGAATAAKDSPGEAQIAWLRLQLASARARHQQVWVMAHIAPTVNVYTTLARKTDVCGGGVAAMFLANEGLSAVMLEYSDVVRLALFGHTHGDEVHLYRDGEHAVASKIVPSISPINGNSPSFTVAEVNPTSAVMMDYTVYTASNRTGAGATWGETYRYSKTYGEPDFSAGSLIDLTGKLVGDRTGSSAIAAEYQKHFFPGDGGLHGMAMRLLWPTYACSLVTDEPGAYRGCVCATK